MMSTKGIALTILLFTSTSTFSQSFNVVQFCADYKISISIKMQGYVKQYGLQQVAELAMTCK